MTTKPDRTIRSDAGAVARWYRQRLARLASFLPALALNGNPPMCDDPQPLVADWQLAPDPAQDAGAGTGPGD